MVPSSLESFLITEKPTSAYISTMSPFPRPFDELCLAIRCQGASTIPYGANRVNEMSKSYEASARNIFTASSQVSTLIDFLQVCDCTL